MDDDTLHAVNGKNRAQVVETGPLAPPRGPPPSTPITPALVAAAQAGDHAAFEALYAHYAAPLRRYLAGIVGHDHGDEAEDLVQDTLLRAYVALPRARFREPRGLQAWLYTIAHRAAIDRLRRRTQTYGGRPPRVRQLQWDHLGLTDARRLATVSAHEEPGFAVVDAASPALERVVRAALDALPAAWRTALVLRAGHHQSMAEIAAAMSTPEGPLSVAAVKGYLWRGRQALRDVPALDALRDGFTQEELER
jgi:RNA polymerase sigma-70 factor (ECF subfamily)